MKKTLILSIALFSAFAAHATCGQRGIPNEICPDTPQAPPTATPATTPPAQASAHAAASAGAVAAGGASNARGGAASQRQAQQASGNGAGAGANAGAGAGAYSGSNSVTIQGAQSGSGDRLTVLPNIPPTPPSTVPGAAIMMTTTACGPQIAAWRQRVTAHYDGITSHDERQQGWSYGWGPAAEYGGDDFRVVDGRRYGHQAIVTYAVVSTGYARTLVLGAGSDSKWGQAGAGGSGANQELVANIQLVPCLIHAAQRQELGQRELTPGKTEVRKVVVRKRIKPKPPCVMEDKTVKVCKRLATYRDANLLP